LIDRYYIVFVQKLCLLLLGLGFEIDFFYYFETFIEYISLLSDILLQILHARKCRLENRLELTIGRMIL